MAKTTPKQLTKSKTPVTLGHKLLNLVRSLKRKTIPRLFILWLTSYLVLMSFFFSSVLKNFSYVEIFPRELVLPTVMHAVTATIITLATYWLPWTKTFTGKLISAVILALLAVGYDPSLIAISAPIRAFLPGITDTDPLALVSLIYLLLLISFSVFIGAAAERLISRVAYLQPRDVQLGVIVLVAYMFIVPASTVFKIFPTVYDQVQVLAPELAGNNIDAIAAGEKPDIYYIVLDRYTNADVLEDQFNFDNSPFLNFLNSHNFHTNDAAYSNYPFTTMSVASTLNAQYTNELVAPYKNSDVQSRTLYHHLIQQASVIKALKKVGYAYHSIGSWYGATYRAPLADKEHMYDHQISFFGFKKRLRGIESSAFKRSPYYRFSELSTVKWWPLKSGENNHLSDVRKQLNLLNSLSTTEQPGGRFIFAHILVPHGPFHFNSDGSISGNPGNDSAGKPIKSKYVGQVEFINGHMQQLVDNIQKQSGGKAVIVFNSDEGPYPQYMNDTFLVPMGDNQAVNDIISQKEDLRTWPDDWLKMKFGILQSVHIPRATSDDLAHLSSVNVFRIILNRYAGYDLDYLPECQFGITRGTLHDFNYADITHRFTANPDAGCAQLQSLPD